MRTSSEHGSVEEAAHPTYEIAAYVVYPTGYQAVPDAADRGKWRIEVANAGDGWAVRWRARCLNYKGTWEFEPPAQARTPEFLKRCRFNEHAALFRARNAVDDLVVDGRTFGEYVASFRRGHRNRARVLVAAQRWEARLADAQAAGHGG